MARRNLLLIACAAVLANAAALAAPSTRYRLDLGEQQAQVVGVHARFDGVEGPQLDVHLPVWRTGLYRILDPVGTLFEVRAQDGDGRDLEVVQTAKSSWRVERGTEATGTVEFSYGVDANSLEDRTRHVDADHAFINPGTVLVYAESHRQAPVTVEVDLPADWRVASGMDSPRPGTLSAPDYDRLVDSPMEFGTFDLVEFDVGAARIQFAIHGVWDGDEARLTADTTRIVETATAVFGELPLSRYVFLTHSAPGLGGGTEYFNSTVVHIDPERWWDDEGYENFLALLAHEFFHTWNVKRFRPAAIDRYDYQKENYTDLLWVAEGLTSYYDEMLLARAGLIDLDAYRERLAANADAVLDRPGYGRDSLASASFEAWTKGYHQGSDRVPTKANRTVSFYAQGGLLGLVLDLELRAASGGERSLDDVMRSLYEDFPLGAGGYRYADVRARVAAAGNDALADRLDGWVLGTAPLPVAEALARVGWQLQRETQDAPEAELGLSLRHEAGGQRVRRVELDGPGWQAGLIVDDLLLAIDGHRIGDGLSALLERYTPGETVALSLFRNGRLRTLPVQLGTTRADHEVVVDGGADAAATALLRGWLGRVDEDGAGDAADAR